ncbi:MAG: hypothetical protein GOV01_00225, partial [Candidatus Altiarchaeota archaeon]|nr:hypothetical protein [Candidatus Altiarchaeota archaeon]
MDYAILAKTYAELEATSSMLAKRDILSKLFSQTPPNLLKKTTYLSMGRVFPPWS